MNKVMQDMSALTEKSASYSGKLQYLSKVSKSIENLLKILDSKIIVKDEDVDSIDSLSLNLDHEQHSDIGNSGISGISGISKDSNSTLDLDVNDCADDIDKDLLDSALNDKNKQIKRKSKYTSCPLLSYKYTASLTLSQERGDLVLNPRTGLLERVWFMDARKHCVTIIHESINSLTQVSGEIMTVRNKEGQEWEINVATTSDLRVKVDKGNVIAFLDSQLQLNEDTPLNLEKKNELCKNLDYTEHLKNVLTTYEDTLVLSPTEYLAHPINIFGMRPMFVGSSMSEQFVIKYIIDYLTIKASKSSLATQSNKLHGDKTFSREYLVNTLTPVVRCFNSLAMQIRHTLFLHSSVWHNDESTWRCRELQQDSLDHKRQNNYIWTLVTGKHEPKKGVVFFSAKGRDKDEFLNQFLPKEVKDCWSPSLYAIDTIITDAYSAYPKGIEELEELIGHKITHAGCFSHLRRYLLDALCLMKLDKVFLNICHCSYSEYNKARDEELKRQGITMGYIGGYILLLAFIVELILRLDCDFAVSNRDYIYQKRQRSLKPLLERFYKTCELILDKTPSMRQYTDSRGVLRVKGGKEYPWGKALCYAINNKEPLSAFLDNPDIECQNNLAELN